MHLRYLLPRRVATLTLVALLAACASLSDPTPAPRKEIAYALTARMELIKFNTGDPQRILERTAISGLPADERLLGLDFRVARGVLYSVSNIGRLYTVNTATAEVKAVAVTDTAPVLPIFSPGRAVAGYALTGSAFGFDFNPVADRIRIVSDEGLNLRLHPDTGVVVDSNPAVPGIQVDGALAYVAGDVNFGKKPTLVAAAYTYNKQDDKLTTNYAIDRDLGLLVMQGSKEGETPVVSPNTGALRSIGPLGLGPLREASFDIADISGAAFAVVRSAADVRTRLFLIDLKTGRASALGTVGDGKPVLGLAIEP